MKDNYGALMGKPVRNCELPVSAVGFEGLPWLGGRRSLWRRASTSDGASLAAGAAAFEDVVLEMEGGGSITIPAEEVGFILGKHSVNATKGTFFGMLRDKLRIECHGNMV